MPQRRLPAPKVARAACGTMFLAPSSPPPRTLHPQVNRDIKLANILLQEGHLPLVKVRGGVKGCGVGCVGLCVRVARG